MEKAAEDCRTPKRWRANKSVSSFGKVLDCGSPLPLFKPVCLAGILFSLTTHAATLPSDWQHQQPFNVSTSSFIKVSLPIETLDAGRSSLEDLRLYDSAGSEVPYVIERPAPVRKAVHDVKSFKVSMLSRSTVLTIETGLTQPLDVVTLESPAMNFLKPVRVEGSADGAAWQSLSQGQPIFRLPYGANKLNVSFPSGVWPWLRLTVDDRRSEPVPFTSARVEATVIEPAPAEWMSANISERNENPGQTRLALNLGAANLSIASLQIETAEPLFTRQLELAVPQISEAAIREQIIGHGVIYKVAVEGQPASENLSVSLETVVHSREVFLLIKNEDSPPLAISGVRIERRPVYLAFLARQPGTFYLLTGNARCAAPRYDLAALGMNLKSLAATPVKIPLPEPNPNFHAPEALAGVETGGAALDTAEWKFRKPIQLGREGAQKVEFDLEVLSRAQPGFGDVRLLRHAKQVPYILEHTSISRLLTPTVTTSSDAKDKTLSRWILKLPQPNLPMTRLRCDARTALFEREMTLYEEVTDERGEKYRNTLGTGTWIQKPDQSRREFALSCASPPKGDTLFLETHNGDNPPIELQKFQVFYPATRVLFKASAGDELFLYYGNADVTPPHYDLGLVADQLVAADKSSVSLGAQQQLKNSSWTETHSAGTGGIIFWGILALLVVVLLVVIARLLPKQQGQL